MRPQCTQISLHNFDFFGPNCMIVAEKCYAQEELKPWNETRKLQLCAIYRRVHRRRHAGGTAVGGKGDCGGEGDSNRRRRRRGGGREGDGLPAGGLGRLSGRDELVGMYFVCILTSPQQRAWRHGDTWIIHGSCMDHIIHQNLWDTCGIRPKNILIFHQIHQIHVSIWGVYRTHFGG